MEMTDNEYIKLPPSKEDGNPAKKRQIWPYILMAVLVPAVLFIVIICVIFLPFRGLLSGTHYEDAKKQGVHLFEKRKDEFFRVKESALAQISVEKANIRGVESITLCQEGNTTIAFAVETGGEDWGIYYSADSEPVYIYQCSLKAFGKGPYPDSYYHCWVTGQYFYATEKIEDNWYFYYMDYDGSRHGLNWRENHQRE